MNTDYHFAIGRQHTICEDYALAGPDWIAVSDGCSESAHSDVGARLICHMAAVGGPDFAAARARPLLDRLGLPPAALDATLLYARHNPDTRSVVVRIYGDGVVVGRRRDGTNVIKVSTFPSGAPLYQNYATDSVRRRGYFAQFGGAHVLHTITEGVNDRWSFDHTPDSADVICCEFPTDTFDLVLLMSDGALSFDRTEPSGSKAPVEITEIVDEMLAIKGFVGEFLTRRVKRFLRDAEARGWRHHDDFAVAGIYLDGVTS